MNFLPPGPREIQTGKLVCGPIGAVMKVPPCARAHQGKLDLPGNVRTVNRPVATLHLAVNRADHAKRNPRDDENQTKGSFVVHEMHSSWHRTCPSRKYLPVSAQSVCPASDSEIRACAPSR